MSRAQRRDHRPDPGPSRQGITLCRSCGDRLRLVSEVYTDDDRPVLERRQVRTYWRHWRRA